MKIYLLRRFLLIIPTFLGITFITFLVTQIVPGGPIDQLRSRALSGTEAGVQGGAGGLTQAGRNNQLSEADLANMIKLYGFDKPWYVQYLAWLNRISHFDLGDSFRYFSPVFGIIKSKLPVSIFYGLVSIVFVYSICIPLGILKAIRHRQWIDNVTSILIFIGYSIPPFAIAMLMLVFLASKLDFFPLGGFVSDQFEYLPTWYAKVWDLIYHAILPLTAYMLGSFASMTILMKNSIIENMASDYVKTALSKGMTFNNAIMKHAFRNSLIPLATSIGNNLSLLLMGSFLIEKIFNIDGMGLLGYTSIVERDYPVVLGILVISSLLTLIGNIISDICVALVDPRVRFE